MNKTSRSILGFMLKAVLTVAPVVLVFVGLYLWQDPFKVIRKYDPYFEDPTTHPARIGINKGLITVENYKSRLREGRSYNGFIFGSSISCYYDAEYWASLAGNDIRPYHFDSSDESLESMADKVEYLDRENQDIDYALIVLDPLIMAVDDNSGPATIAPPDFEPGLCHFIRYHYIFFRASTNADFLKSWLPAYIYGLPYDNGHNVIYEKQPIEYDPVTNQESIPEWDRIISRNPIEFYSQYPLMAPPDSVSESPSVLTAEKVEMLERISRVFASRHTDYQIIVGPNRRKVALSPADRKVLERIFEPSRVHDYSRALADYLEEDTLLYDNTHYRPVFASRLMDSTYK